MENKIRELLKDKLNDMNLLVDSAYLEKENNNLFLRICLDSENVLDLDTIVKATKIIDPIIEKADLIDEAYILEVYGKSKGDIKNEEN